MFNFRRGLQRAWGLRQAVAARQRQHQRLHLEPLESRDLLAAIPAFAGAEGAGAFAAGGRGGDVYHVTNLNSSGPGSFAEGITTAPSVGRTIVFDVGGYIDLPETLRLTASNITVAGQTAPGDGIGFKNGTFWVSGDDVVVRYARFLDNRGGDAVDIDSGSNNSIFDHVTIAFGNDENFSTWDPPENMTFQYSINAWGLESHSAGGLWNLNHGTSHHSLWAHNHTRNPKARPQLLDWVNNVTFDWDIGFIMGDSETPADWKANVRGNYFVATSPKTIALEKAQLDRNGNPNFTLYLDDSVLDGNDNGVLDVSRSGYSIASGAYAPAAAPLANTGVPVTVDDHLTAYKKVVSSAGPVCLDADPAKPLRDELNALLLDNLVDQRRHRVSSASETGASNGGFGTLASAPAPVDTDRDGMPDYWEMALGLNPGVDDHNDLLGSSGGVLAAGSFFPDSTPAGYTQLEEYLQFLAMPHGTVVRNTSADPSFLDVDLRKYASGFTNSPVFALSEVTGGTAALQPDGHTVRFVPTTNAIGRGKFDFRVVDADGSEWTQQFAVLVEAGVSRNLLWQGDGSANAWNSTAENWLEQGAPPATAFSAGDTVTFADTGSNSPAVNVTGTQLPGGMTVNANRNYTIGGTGSIGGTAALRKDGTGTLTIGTANSFAGGMLIDQGNVILNNATAAGSGIITMDGGALTLGASINNPIAVTSPSSLTTGGNTLGGEWTGDDTLNVTISGSNTFTTTGSMSGFGGTVSLGASSGFFRMNGSLGSSAATFDLGTGSADLLNRNGNATIHLGALLGGPNTALRGASSTSYPTTYVLGGNNLSTTFGGAITNGAGTAAITKTGSGALTLTGTSTYTGATTLSGGELCVDGTLGNTAVTVGAGAVLSGSGLIGSATGGAVAAQSGSTVSPGSTPGSAGVLTVGNGLALNAATLALDLSSSPSGTNDKIQLNGGTLSLSGTIVVQINMLDGFLNPGTYRLIDGGTATSVSSVILSYTPPSGTRQTFALQRSSTTSGQGYLNLVVGGDPATLIWRGTDATSPGTWDLNTTANWANGAASDRFFNLDAVIFDDTSSHGEVAVSGSVEPRSITIANTATAYALSGTGSITGPGSLTKTGTGSLTIANANSFSGGTSISNSTVVLANDAADASGLGTGPITLHGGTITMSNDFSTYGNATFHLIVPAGETGNLDADSRCDLFGTLSGGGTFKLNLPSNGNSYPSFRTNVYADGSAFTGSIQVTTTDAQGGDFRLATNYAYPGFPNAAVSLEDHVSAYYTGIVAAGAGTVVEIGELSGTAMATLMGGVTGWRMFTWRIGGRNTDATFAGTIREQNASTVTSLIKAGGGTWTLSGTADYRGDTLVEQGTLKVSGWLSSGGGNFEVGNGATLNLAQGTITTDTVHIAVGGTLSGCGTIHGDLINDGTVTAFCPQGTLAIRGESTNNGTMLIGPGGVLEFNGPVVNDGLIDARNGTLRFNSTLVNNGTILIAPTAGPDNYVVAEDTPLAVLAPGLLANDTDIGQDTLQVTGVNTAGMSGTLVSWSANGSFIYQPAANFNGQDGFDYTVSDGRDGTATAHVTLTVTAAPDVIGRYVFYNNSAWDGNSAAADDRDYDAIAPAPTLFGHGHAGELDEPGKDLAKRALLPGQAAGFVNYSSYSKGINGILIIVDDVVDPSALSADDFVFRVGNSDTPASWSLAPQPLLVSPGMRIRVDEDVEHAGFPGHPDVVTITWAEDDPYTATREPGAISNQWLQVTVLANARTGLAANDVFYFGHQIGESGNSAADTNVDQNDEIGVRNHPHTAFNAASISDPYDFDRDGKVDQNDEILARNNPASAFTRIQLITAAEMLQAEGVPLDAAPVDEKLTAPLLAPTVEKAVARWKATGLDLAQLQMLRQTQFVVASLPGSQLGEASMRANVVCLDDDAAGFAWFFDSTPAEDEEFPGASRPSSTAASPQRTAAGEVDLLTAVMHEMGHLVGKPDLDGMADDVMADRLAPGMRRGVSRKPCAVHDAAIADATEGGPIETRCKSRRDE